MSSTITQRLRADPMTWKDWITAAGFALTLGTVLVQGGRLVERQDAANAKLNELAVQLSQAQRDLGSTQRDLEQQRGRDLLHEEQIRNLRRDLDALAVLSRKTP